MDTVFYQPAASPHQAKYRGGGVGGSTMSGGARAFQGAYDSISNRPHHA